MKYFLKATTTALGSGWDLLVTESWIYSFKWICTCVSKQRQKSCEAKMLNGLFGPLYNMLHSLTHTDGWTTEDVCHAGRHQTNNLPTALPPQLQPVWPVCLKFHKYKPAQASSITFASLLQNCQRKFTTEALERFLFSLCVFKIL